VDASDTDSCCTGECIISFKGSMKQLTTWIAIGLGVIIVALVIFLVLRRPRGVRMPAETKAAEAGAEIPSELSDYVVQARKQKMSDKEIRAGLNKYGWDKGLIDKALKK